MSITNRSVTARRVVGIVFPQRLLLKIDSHAYTAAVLRNIITAAGEVKSHRVAAKVLRSIGGISISDRHINRLTEEIGTQLANKRDQSTEDYVHHRRPAVTVPAPQVVSIFLDGGRLRTRQPGHGAGVHEPQWKEDKVACLLTLKSETFAQDPHPEPPRCFLDALQVDQLVREIQTRHGPRQENELPQLEELSLGKQAVASEGPPLAVEEKPDKIGWPPERTKAARTCVATMQDSAAFGKMVAAEAYHRNFHEAQRGALLGDGSAWIWTLHSKWFSWLTAVTDFVHPMTYLYVTATVLASNVVERWQCYGGWLRDVWQGRVGQVIADLQSRWEKLGPYDGPGPPPATDPREVLRRTITYLQNNQERMNYPAYRQQGLPVTSSAVESLIKEINYRVKGTEKFWNNPQGAEAILQVRAALLSDDDRLAKHIESRRGSPLSRYKKRKNRKDT